MKYDEETKDKVLLKTDSSCHICRKKLLKKNYGVNGANGAWEIDHSKPIAVGGTNHINNLYPACISCNRSKGSLTNSVARKPHGFTTAPKSKAQKNKEKKESVIKGGLIGGGIGLIFGPLGMVVGSSIGALIGSELEGDK